jgi:hypothetical protein
MAEQPIEPPADEFPPAEPPPAEPPDEPEPVKALRNGQNEVSLQ